jgi:hypothetical protein
VVEGPTKRLGNTRWLVLAIRLDCQGRNDGRPGNGMDAMDVGVLEDVVEDVNCRGNIAARDDCTIKAKNSRTKLLR